MRAKHKSCRRKRAKRNLKQRRMNDMVMVEARIKGYHLLVTEEGVVRRRNKIRLP